MFTVFVNLSAKSEVLSLRKKYLVGIKEGGGAIFNIKIFFKSAPLVKVRINITSLIISK